MATVTKQESGCRHCGTALPTGEPYGDFCCAGCQAVYQLLHEENLTSYYKLAGGKQVPAAEPQSGRSHAWLDALLERSTASSSGIFDLDLDVQGIHCAGCVWLFQELYRRQPGGCDLQVNPGMGKVRLRWRDGFDVRGWIRSVEKFGYLFGPSRKKAQRSSLDLPLRLGICAAITMNVMIFSVSFYVGLAPDDAGLFALFTKLTVWLSTAVVIIGGWPFFRSAWQGLKAGMLHLDLPIATGILLAWGTSMVQAQAGRGDLAYFDTLNTFVTLMLTGRWLQQRVVERNRRFLLEDDGADGIVVRRQNGDQIETIPAPRVAVDDLLVVAPGDLVPVDAELQSESGSFSTDWITGEADVREIGRGEPVPAGAFNAGHSAVTVRATSAFADSPLVALLSAAPAKSGSRSARFWDRLARYWVAAVLVIASLGFLLWWPAGPRTALDVAVALLIVTCPCAIGIAIPLAYELVQARLRREGIFVRNSDLLDRLPQVRKILFDKTGTLTLNRLELQNPGAVLALDPQARDAAYDMTARSNHPVSRCLAEALGRAGAHFSDAEVVEIPGKGLTLQRDGVEWRLGASSWTTGASGKETLLTRDGEVVARFAVRESLRAGTAQQLAALQEDGNEIWLISGDAPEKVQRLARELGVPPERALGGQKPEQKAEAVSRIDARDTLYLGDGVNDSLAFDRALCAGTPAIDRPVMPGKADFFLLGESLAGVQQSLRLARLLQRTVRRILALALTYNALAIAASLAGWMTPLRAAIAMPASSITVILLAVFSLRRGRDTAEMTRRAALARVMQTGAPGTAAPRDGASEQPA